MIGRWLNKNSRWLTQNDLWLKNWVIYAIFCLIALFLYGKTINYGYALDDHLFIDHLPNTGSFLSDIRQLFNQRFNNGDYRPILILSYYLEKVIAGDLHPQFSHLINVLLYISSMIAIYHFTNQFAGKQHLYLPLLITLLFLAHPIHANVVCNLKSRDNLLSMLLGILSCSMIYAYFVEHKNWLKLIAGYVLFLAALCSKLDALGFIIFITLLLSIQQVRIKYLIANAILLIIILYSIRMGLVDILVPIDITQPLARVTFTENPLISATSILDRYSSAIHTGWIYLLMMVKPVGYYFYFGYDQIRLLNFRDLIIYMYLILQLAFVAAAIFSYKKNKLFFLGVFGFYGFLLYCLNYKEVMAGIVADRYAYLASYSYCIAIVSVAIFLKAEQQKYFYWMIIGYAVLLSGFSFNRASAWKDKITLIETDMPHLERSYEAQRIAAATYMEYFSKTDNASYLANALYHAKTANAIYPPNALMHKMEGMILFQMKEYDKAKTALQLSFRNDSTSSETLEMLGDISFVEKDYRGAQQYYTKAWIVDPLSNELINKISTAIYTSGDKDACLDYNLQLVKTEPKLWAPYENLGYYYLEQSDSAKARSYFDLARQKGLKDNTPV